MAQGSKFFHFFLLFFSSSLRSQTKLYLQATILSHTVSPSKRQGFMENVLTILGLVSGVSWQGLALYIPVQPVPTVVPSPSQPSIQAHVNEPSMSVHVAMVSTQLSALVSHSSISSKKKNRNCQQQALYMSTYKSQ